MTSTTDPRFTSWSTGSTPGRYAAMWFLSLFFFPLSFMFSDVPSWKQQQIRYKPHPFPRGQKRPRPTYFLMSERTQSVCGVKSTICHSNPTSAAPFIHRQVVLLTQNNTPAKMKHEGSLSLPSYATIWSRPVGFPYWYRLSVFQIITREARNPTGEVLVCVGPPHKNKLTGRWDFVTHRNPVDLKHV